MRALAVLVVLACSAGVAAGDDKPWAEGVGEADQARALALYRDGNEHFVQSRFLEALAQYQVALASWDHPSIRYNAAVCLINLGRHQEAYENLIAALRFGGEPLSAELKQQAQTYRALLEGQLAELEVQCKEPGATVMLDGKQLLACPGSQARRLAPGRHQVVGEKPGYETDSRAIELSAGKKTTIVLELKLLGERGKLVRRWNRWLPWSVLAGGVAIGGLAVPLALEARSDYRAWDAQLVAFCGQGCDPATLDADQRAALDGIDRERRRTALYAYASIAVGATAIAASFTMVLLNQPRLAGAEVKPEIGKDHASLSIRGRW